MKLEVCPVEVGVTAGLIQRMGKDADVDTTEAADSLGTQIAIVHAGKMREMLIVRSIIEVVELWISGDAQVYDVLMKGDLFLDMFHLADADLGLQVPLAISCRTLHVIMIMVGCVDRDACHATIFQP